MIAGVGSSPLSRLESPLNLSAIARSAALAAAIASAAALSGCAAPGAGPGTGPEPQAEAALRLRTSYVVFPQAGVPQPLSIPGKLQIPAQMARQSKLPAVVIVHGTNGIDSRGSTMAAALHRAGIATLEIDQWSPRGVTGAANRPKNPYDAVPDVYGAFRLLADHPAIDANRIGITGFSWGGVMALLTAQGDVTAKFAGPGRGFDAHLAFYPVCWLYNANPPVLPPLSKLTGAPVRILVGADDHYEGDPQACPQMLQRLPEADRRAVSVKVYPNATHGFDISEDCTPPYEDPAANRGQGGTGRSCPNPAARADSRREAVEFFGRAFGLR